ncbi:hypothetical protein HK104_005640, partial [Borealophlyctis nickersoniae]
MDPRDKVVVVRASPDPSSTSSSSSTDSSKKPYRVSGDSGIGSEDESNMIPHQRKRAPSRLEPVDVTSQSSRTAFAVDELLLQLEDAIHSFDGPTLARGNGVNNPQSVANGTATPTPAPQRASAEHKLVAQHRHDRRPSVGSVMSGSSTSTGGVPPMHERRPSASSGSPVTPTTPFSDMSSLSSPPTSAAGSYRSSS